jgi:hypothetical protein
MMCTTTAVLTFAAAAIQLISYDYQTLHVPVHNKQEPYNGGIKFSAMPPGKRLRDMDQVRTLHLLCTFTYACQHCDTLCV